MGGMLDFLLGASPFLLGFLLYKYADFDVNQALTAFFLSCFVFGAGFVAGKHAEEKGFSEIYHELSASCQKVVQNYFDEMNSMQEPEDRQFSHPRP